MFSEWKWDTGYKEETNISHTEQIKKYEGKNAKLTLSCVALLKTTKWFFFSLILPLDHFFFPLPLAELVAARALAAFDF